MCVLMPTETEAQSCLRQCSTSGMSIASSVDTGRSADQSCSIGRHCCIKSVSTMCTAKKSYSVFRETEHELHLLILWFMDSLN